MLHLETYLIIAGLVGVVLRILASFLPPKPIKPDAEPSQHYSRKRVLQER